MAIINLTAAENELSIMIDEVAEKIVGLTSMSVSFSKEMEEWFEYPSTLSTGQTTAWRNRRPTATDMQISCVAKRNYGAKANDKIHECTTKVGDDTIVKVKLVNYYFTYEGNFVVEANSAFGGEPNSLDELEFNLLAAGAITITKTVHPGA